MSNTDNSWPEDPQDPAPESHDAAAPPDAERIAQLEAEHAGLRDRLLRALAETENVRRRGEREREDTARFAISRFAGDLLSVSDNLRRALEAVPAEAMEGNDFLAKLVDGVAATERELANAFEKNGLQRIDPADRIFDPNFHEVMFEMDAPDKQAGTVMQVFQSGYKIGDRLLRPARVAVAKGGPKTTGVDTKA